MDDHDHYHDHRARAQHKWLAYRAFFVTFLAYTCFHMTRKVPSVVKSVLHPLSSTGRSSYDPVDNPGWGPFNRDIVPSTVADCGYTISNSGLDGGDGLYSCVVRFESSVGEACFRFVHSGYEIVLGANEECPFSDLKLCWVVRDISSHKIYFAQDYGGPIPANAGASDAPDVIHWKKKGPSFTPWDGGFSVVDKNLSVKPACGDGAVLLGALDSVFLSCYTIGLFFSGFLGDRVNLRYFLTIGMFGCSICMFLMGLAYVWKIHSMIYFIFVNILFGFFQSVGWPSVVSVMGSWFGHGTRGLIMGIWNSHTSIGNILGSVVTAAAVGSGMHHEDWPLGYTLPGLIMAVSAFLIFLLLIPSPKDAGLDGIFFHTEEDVGIASLDDEEEEDYRENDHLESDNSLLVNNLEQELLQQPPPPPRSRTGQGEGEDCELNGSSGSESHSFVDSLKLALAIPGLIPFSLSLMFSKMCAYSVLFWGPYYLGSVGFTSERAGYLCSFFDIGGIFGGITAGYLSDKLKARGLVAFCFQLLSIPAMGLYYQISTATGPVASVNIWLMIFVGFFVNAPYALITTAVSADLGTQIKGNDKLLSFVTGIIDGTGSFGAVIQGIVVGFMSTSSWASVWHFLMIAQGFSALMISRLVYYEVKKLFFTSS